MPPASRSRSWTLAGMGAALLAISVLRSSDAGLAAAVFGPWMNISGSVLASWWRGRPPTDRIDA